MDNFEAIKQMDRASMEAFLDQVYLTGLNTGMYAATLPNDSEDQLALLDKNPFDEAWLVSEAEPALLDTYADGEDEHVLNALAAAVLRSAGIHTPEEMK